MQSKIANPHTLAGEVVQTPVGVGKLIAALLLVVAEVPVDAVVVDSALCASPFSKATGNTYSGV